MATALTAGTKADRLSWHANLTSMGWAVPSFLLVWIGIVVVPLIIVVFFSFFKVVQYRVVFEWTTQNWVSLIETGRWMAVARTLRVMATITVIEFLLAFPFALWLAKGCRSKGLKATIITLLTIPFFLDASSRIIVWRSILGRNGVVNSVLMGLGITDEPVEWMLFSEFAVHFGMIGPYFPNMLFPIYLSLTLIDDEYLQASADLGASPLQTLTSVILPLALPGIVAGFVFTLVPLMAAFVEPQMLGGGKVNLLGDSVDAALRELKYPTAAALSTVVIAILALMMTLLVVVMRRRADLGSIFAGLRR